MLRSKVLQVESPIGRQETDSAGSPVGVVRMDAEKSYANIGLLLQEYINEGKEAAWEAIKKKIDYTYEGLDLALASLEAETGFGQEIKLRLAKGQKLLFKPNLVNIQNIDPQTHGPDVGSTACTEWSFIAALMRWFHEKAGVSYYQMTVGEAATMMPASAGLYSMLNPGGKPITVEATMEGKSGNFYGGWGFYFARKYLSESLGPGATEDPMRGYEESTMGTYIPPGLAKDRLMVYDLNRIFDDPSKGREIPVKDGVNYKSITLHKAIVGGNPDDPADRKAYPGCILINVPKFKVHAIAIFTNVIKNLGIGLYPMQFSKSGDYTWDYSTPHTRIPGIKAGIPHQVWVSEIDHDTGVPKQDQDGCYIVKKTGGLTATMIDIIRAVIDQDIFMIHVVDGIEAINLDHQGIGLGKKYPEGIVFVGLDPVATDLLSARYMFSNVPLKDALAVDMDDGTGGHFPQVVPIAVVEGKNIVTGLDFDCCISRDRSFGTAEKRGLGKRKYYVVGRDAISDSSMVSIHGHLGAVHAGVFSDVITSTLYFDVFKFPWDLQKTAFSYFDAVDTLTGSSLKKEFLEAFDEDGDGIITYEEYGEKGIWGLALSHGGEYVSLIGNDPLGHLKGLFYQQTTMSRLSNPLLNPKGHGLFKEFFYGPACVAALQITQAAMEMPDPFLPDLTFGKGKWPSFQLASYFFTATSLYGREFPNKLGFPSLYGAVLFYADLSRNGGQYAGKIRRKPDPDGITRYVSDVAGGKVKPLDFTLYVPHGFESVNGVPVPNIEATTDPAKVYTACFSGGKEIWDRIGA
ncbi:MAG: DUF362 domain-containing protein [Deltaproteobacteria bacterium]|nr:DUF362 domain-containing protein [Deltaproteobacteria bacterium]